MGYYANGSGDATIKEEVTNEMIEKAIEALGEPLEYSFDIYRIGSEELGTMKEARSISFVDYDKYYEEDVCGFLDTISPFITEGSMYYTGEDGAHWRFVFNPETGKWTEESGTVDYDFSAYSDDQLIEELKNRGYQVMKAA